MEPKTLLYNKSYLPFVTSPHTYTKESTVLFPLDKMLKTVSSGGLKKAEGTRHCLGSNLHHRPVIYLPVAQLTQMENWVDPTENQMLFLN